MNEGLRSQTVLAQLMLLRLFFQDQFVQEVYVDAYQGSENLDDVMEISLNVPLCQGINCCHDAHSL